MSFIVFLLLGASFFSLWIRKDPKIWGGLLGCSLLCGWVAGNVSWTGLFFILVLAFCWVAYRQKPNLPLFILLLCISALFKAQVLPGYTPFFFTPRFAIGLQGSLIGLFPLAFVVPLARGAKEWKIVLKGVFLGCAGIAFMAVLAILNGATHWEMKLPNFAIARILSNFWFTCIPEEGFFRGFIQNTFCTYFKNVKFGKIVALVVTSSLFTTAHIYWAPNMQILVFVFLAGLLYGGVYLISGKIESSIFSHFLLNFVHMTFFSYHAM